MRIILKPMGAFVIVASLLLLALGTLYGVVGRGGAGKPSLGTVAKLTTIPEMLAATQLPSGFALSPQAKMYQAEDAILSGPIAMNRAGSSENDVVRQRTSKGGGATGPGAEVKDYSGTGFADYQKYTDDYVEWTVNVPKDGEYRLLLRYAANTKTGVRALKVTYGGDHGVAQVAADRLVFPNLGSWDVWGMAETKATLKAGVNKVRATACSSSGPNIDALIVDPR
jgi:hypothetical protein